MNYEKYIISNEEALLVAAHGDQSALEIVRRNFRNFIKKTCGTFHLENRDLNLDFEELLFAGEIALHHAIGAYHNNGVPFAAFASTVIERGINSVIRSQRSLTNTMLRKAISFDSGFTDNDDSTTIADIVGEEDIYTSKSYDTKMINHIEDLVSVRINPSESLIIRERLEGYTFFEICDRNAISRRKMASIVDGIKDKYDLMFD